MGLILVVGIFLLCLWWIISPFMPKEQKQPTVVNNIHIVNSPYNSNDGSSHYSQEQPERDTENNSIFNNRIRF